MARDFDGDGWDDGGTPMWRSRHARPAVILDGRRRRLTFGQCALLIVFAGFVLPLAIVVVGLSAMGVAHAWLGW